MNMFCMSSQNHHHFYLKNNIYSLSILKQNVEELKTGIESLVDQAVFQLWNSQNIDLSNILRITCT